MVSQIVSEHPTVHTRSSEISINDQFTVVSVKSKIQLEIADLVEVAQALCRRGVVRDSLIIFFQGSFGASKRICDYYCSPDFGCTTDYHAIVTTSFFKRITLTAMMLMRRPQFKFRLFRNVDNAVNWLNKQQQKSIKVETVAMRIQTA
jgi:hypothetical protein